MLDRIMQATLGSLLSLVATACQAQSAPGGETGPASDKPFTERAVAEFGTPWAIEFVPGSALVSEKDGKLWAVNLDTGAKSEIAGVPKAHVAGQGGLGDVAAHPQFAANRRIYLSYVEAGPDGTSGAVLGYGTLLQVGPPAAGAASGIQLSDFRVIWRQSPKVTGNGHFAHRIAFGPDGLLYLTSGDRQKFDPAQDMGGNLGKVLRLTDEGAAAPGNPWASRGGVAAQFYSIGQRNPLGIAFAPDGRLWESEMGPKGGDELNLITAGKNYGYPTVSNGSHYDGRDIPDHKAGDGFEAPKAWWNPSISPGGLMIYNGNKFPGWKGDAFLPVLSGKALIRVDLNGDKAKKADHWDMGRRIRAVEQGPDGRVFILEDEGKLVELVPAK